MPEKHNLRSINTGVVGCGFIGRIHVEALRRIGYVNVLALASRSQEIADAKAAELSIPKAYGNWFDLVEDEDIEVVHISTTNELHYPVARACIEAGKHVICEKPLALTAKEAKELLRIADNRGIVHAVCHSLRYYPLVKQARAMVQAGEVGTVRLIHGHYLQDWLFLETDYNWRLISELSGKSRAVADIGTHWLDMVQHVTEQRIISVCADMTTFIPVRKKPIQEVETYSQQQLKHTEYEDVEVDTEDHATVMLRFSEGAKGVLVVSQVCAGRKNYIHFEINGSRSSLGWNGENANLLWIGERGKVNGEFIKNPAIMDPYAARYAGAPCGLEEGYLDTFKYIFSDVYEWIREEEQMDTDAASFPTFKTGYELLCIVEAIFRSSGSGTWEEVRL
jgi:predicted dehydrogenase